MEGSKAYIVREELWLWQSIEYDSVKHVPAYHDTPFALKDLATKVLSDIRTVCRGFCSTSAHLNAGCTNSLAWVSLVELIS